MSDSPAEGSSTSELVPTQSPALVRTGKSLAQLEQSIAHYPDEIRTEVRWMQGFYLDHCRNNGELLRSICAKLGHDKSREYFQNLIGGHYFRSKTSTWLPGGKGWRDFSEMMAALRRHAHLLSRTGKLPFVQTPTYFSIANFITAKRAPSAVCRIGGIIAPTGGQTSESFKFYQSLNNHGAVIHIEAPANGRLSTLQAKLLEAYHVSGCKLDRANGRERELRAHINESRCIIIDNAQSLYQRRLGNQQETFGWIREIYDDARPTLILKFTEEFLQDLTGASAKGYFEQFIGRMGGMRSILRLPAYATNADLVCIAASFGLAKSAVDDFLHPWSRQEGRIRIVFDKLQRAQEFASSDNRERITLDDLRAADEFTPGETEIEEGGAS